MKVQTIVQCIVNHMYNLTQQSISQSLKYKYTYIYMYILFELNM